MNSLTTKFVIGLLYFCATVHINANNLTSSKAVVSTSFMIFDSKIKLSEDNAQARVNDILYCSVNSISSSSGQMIQTNKSVPYQYILAPSEGCIKFHVLAKHTGNIALANELKSALPTFSIVLGGWWNTKSGIYTNNGRAQTTVITPDILTDKVYREFWIEWNNNMVRVGKGGELRNFMLLNDPNHLKINFIGFATSEVDGVYLVKNAESNCFAPNKLTAEAFCSL